MNGKIMETKTDYTEIENEFVKLFNDNVDNTYFDEQDVRWFIFDFLLDDYLYTCRRPSDYKLFVKKLNVLGEKIGYDMVSLVMSCLYDAGKEFEYEREDEAASEMFDYIKKIETASGIEWY